MCVRTKTSYDCGHSFKEYQVCDRKSCRERERYHFENEGDCRRCREGGEATPCGRDGHDRYGRHISKKEPRTSIPRSPLSVVTDSQNGQASPWAAPSRRERGWRSPIRKMADEAWENEHLRREEDLQRRVVGSKVSSGGSLPSYLDNLSPSPSSPSLPSPLDRHRGGRDDREAAIREEMRRMEDVERVWSRRRRERQPSYDSFESLGGSHRSHHAYSQGYSHGHNSRSQYQDEDYHIPSSGHRSPPRFHRSRTYDSGFGSRPKYEKPYNLYNTEQYLSGLGQEFGELVRDSGRRWTRR
jgi:hypothetical protein